MRRRDPSASSKTGHRKECPEIRVFSTSTSLSPQAPEKLPSLLTSISASRRFKLNQKIQTQASFLSASFYWLPSSWRHHAGRFRGALLLGAGNLRRAAQRKLPDSASPWQRKGCFRRRWPKWAGLGRSCRWESATWDPQATSRPSGAGPRPWVQGVGETVAGGGWCVPSARGRGGACWV